MNSVFRTFLSKSGVRLICKALIYQGFFFWTQKRTPGSAGGIKKPMAWKKAEKSLQVRVSEKFADQYLQKRGD
jgi:hypothetical protein